VPSVSEERVVSLRPRVPLSPSLSVFDSCLETTGSPPSLAASLLLVPVEEPRYQPLLAGSIPVSRSIFSITWEDILNGPFQNAP
jgi:hypothetical protein